MSVLCLTYHWPPDFYRRMGWRLFWAWVRECRQVREGVRADTDRWQGAEQDPWWAEQRAKREKMRGRR